MCKSESESMSVSEKERERARERVKVRKRERERNAAFQLPTWCVIFDPWDICFPHKKGDTAQIDI